MEAGILIMEKLLKMHFMFFRFNYSLSRKRRVIILFQGIVSISIIWQKNYFQKASKFCIWKES